jgi:ubiquitin carboxyl-terminal hydrolase 34
MEGKEPQWIEFNDKDVRIFDPRDISTECFGGMEEVVRWNPATKTHRRETVEKSRNAYMLIYDRIQDFPPEREKPKENNSGPAVEQPGGGGVVVAAPSQTSPAVASQAPAPVVQPAQPPNPAKVEQLVRKFVHKLKRNVEKRRGEDYFTVAVPPELHEMVWQENELFFKHNRIFDEDYFAFILKLLQTVPIEPSKDYHKHEENLTYRIIAFALDFFILIMSKSKAKATLKDFTDYLALLLESNYPACKYICSNLNSLQSILLEAPAVETRAAAAEIIFAAIKTLLQHERPTLLQEKDKDSMEIDEGEWVKTTIHNLYQWVKQKKKKKKKHRSNVY